MTEGVWCSRVLGEVRERETEGNKDKSGKARTNRLSRGCLVEQQRKD